MIEPLFEDDDDQAILDEAYASKKDKPKKSLYEIRGPNGEQLPPGIQAALAEYVDTSRADAEANTPAEFRAASSLLDHWAGMNKFMTDGAALIAMYEVLDAITEGQLTLLSKYHESRRQIIYTKLLAENVRSLLAVLDPNETKNYINELWLYLDVYLDFIYFTSENAIADYRHLSTLCNREVDESFIETGIITRRTYQERVLFASPAAYEDEPD